MHPVTSRSFVPAFIAAWMVAATVALGALAASPARGATYAVAIADFAFAPATLTITAGDTVTWTNEDPVAHTATSTTGAFDSGELAQGESFSFTFTAAGTYDYLCTPHPSMTGRIVVQAAAPAPTTAPSAPSSTPGPGGGELPDVAMPLPDGEPSRTPLVAIGLVAAALGLAGALGVARARSG